VASVILFAGGHGALGLRGAASMQWGTGNFLVRTRDLLAAEGFNVAVADAPADQQKGMTASFRMSAAHAGDIAALAGWLKQQADVPVWLMGTSMGTFSAAKGAIAAGGIDGLVLTSTITRAHPDWRIARDVPDGVASMSLDRVSVPTLIVAHRHDGCAESPASGAATLKARLSKAAKVEVAMLDGGAPPKSPPCEAKSQHGYYGIEKQAIATIARFIKANLK
jgi:pimeloyl-ACP methyl ester carboxylesterase